MAELLSIVCFPRNFDFCHILCRIAAYDLNLCQFRQPCIRICRTAFFQELLFFIIKHGKITFRRGVRMTFCRNKIWHVCIFI